VSLAPLLNADWHLQVHALAAMAAVVLGLAQFAGTKGTTPHRPLGFVWVALMLGVSVAATCGLARPSP
jgi:uncharacterized membrane protein